MSITFNESANYFELTIENEPSPHLVLLDLFHKPDNILGNYYDKIFNKNEDYLTNHKEIQLTKDFLAWNGWLFRGHQDKHWLLQSTLERLIHNKVDRDYFKIEMGMIRDFKRRISNFESRLNSLEENDFYEWIANMQHYGCKTRFLDVTFSFFVAIYFAIQNIEFGYLEDDKEKINGSFSIWCFNRMWIEKRYKKFLPDSILDLYKKYDEFGKDVRIQDAVLNYVPNKKNENNSDYKDLFKCVINMTPFIINQRLDRQKGSFLVPTNPYVSFEKNLFNMIEEDDDIFNLIKINIEYSDKTLLYLLKMLDEMNNNSTVLFNNIEGLCQHINFKSRIPNDSLVVSRNKGILR